MPDPTSCCIIIADGKAKCKTFVRAEMLSDRLLYTILYYQRMYSSETCQTLKIHHYMFFFFIRSFDLSY